MMQQHISYVNASIDSFVATRKIATLHDLGLELARLEGVPAFEDLGLGPLVSYGLAVEYFAPASVLAAPPSITAGDVVRSLAEYMGTLGRSKKVEADQLLLHMARQRGLPSASHLCVRVQSLGMYIAAIMRAKGEEQRLVVEWEEGPSNGVLARQEPDVLRRTKQFLAGIEAADHKGQQQELSSGPIEAVRPKGKVNRLPESDTSSSEGNAELDCHRETAPALAAAAHRPGFYPSEVEEKRRLQARKGSQRPGEKLRSKRKAAGKHDLAAGELGLPWEMAEAETRELASAWTEICCSTTSLHEVLNRLGVLGPSHKKLKKKACRRQELLTQALQEMPARGILNVAVMSMRLGHWGPVPNAAEARAPASIITTEEMKAVVQRTEDDAAVAPISRTASGVMILEESVAEALERSLHALPLDWSAPDDALAMLSEWTATCQQIACQVQGGEELKNLEERGFSTFLRGSPRLAALNALRTSVTSPAVVQREAAPIQVSARGPVLAFMRQLLLAKGLELNLNLADNKQVHDEVRRQACTQFGVDYVDVLKLDSLADILKQLEGGASLGLEDSQSGHVAYLTAVMAETCKDVGALGQVTDVEALRRLEVAPALVDFGAWSCWRQVFEPSLGLLSKWVRSLHQAPGRKLPRLCIKADGAVFKICESSTAEDFLRACMLMDAVLAALHLVSVVVNLGGPLHSPLALLRSHATRSLSILLASFTPVALDNTTDTADAAMARSQVNLSSSTADVVYKEAKRRLDTDVGNEHGVQSNKRLRQAAALVEADKRPGSELVDGRRRVANFVLGVLWHLPRECRTLGMQVLVPGFASIFPAAHEHLLEAAVRADRAELASKSRVSMLHALGLEFGIESWIAHYEQVMQQSGPDTEAAEWPAEEDKSYGAMVGIAEQAADAKRQNSSHMDTELSEGGKACESMCNLVPATLADSGVIESDAKHLVSTIRKEEFGIDSDDQQLNGLLERQHARMGRALQRLSLDLYSSDTHFVLELVSPVLNNLMTLPFRNSLVGLLSICSAQVQNADDNCYVDGEVPEVAFLLDKDQISVLNNERGFTFANLQALCDVGRSTKLGDLHDLYTGQKGIGFKSVFRITDAPEIHSGGFHVRFDLSIGPLGYILPFWIDDDGTLSSSTKNVLSSIPSKGVTWRTHMKLPLKPCLRGAKACALAAKLADLHPSLLLFLRRLRRIHVADTVTGSHLSMARQELGNGLVQVFDSQRHFLYLLHHRTITVASTWAGRGLQASRGPTKISLAFPLRETPDGHLEAAPARQQVFVFLPVRSYGLKFVVQADFALPSSREDVDRDNPWNQWLRQQVADAVVDAVTTFRALPNVRGAYGGLSEYLAFVPAEGEALGFFAPLPRMIFSQLSTTLRLPAESGSYKLPCQLVALPKAQAEAAAVLHVVTPQLLQQHLGLDFLDHRIQVPEAVSAGLGILSFSAATLVALMEALCTGPPPLVHLQALGRHWVSHWMALLRSSLQASSSTSLTPLARLTKLRFLPLADDSFAALEDAPLWYVDGDALEHLKQFPALLAQLRLIHPQLLEACRLADGCPIYKSPGRIRADHHAGEDEVAEARHETDVSAVADMLKKLGVCKLVDHDILELHILPGMASGRGLSQSEDSLLEQAAFCKRHFESACLSCSQANPARPTMRVQLGKAIVLVTTGGLARPCQQPVHFPRAWRNPVDARLIFKEVSETIGLEWMEVNDRYLRLGVAADEDGGLTSWRAFFTSIGVTDFLQVQEVSDARVVDWTSNELDKVLDGLASAKASSSSYARLAEALDCLWDQCYARYAYKAAKDSNNKYFLPEEPSTFLQTLQNSCWLPCTIDGALCRPMNLVVRSPAIEHVLGPYAPYVACKIASTNFAACLRLQEQVTVSTALCTLRNLESRSSKGARIEQMSHLYQMLQRSIADGNCGEVIKEFLEARPFIFLPTARSMVLDRGLLQCGRLLPSTSVFWKDATGLLDKLRRLLDSNEAEGGECLVELANVYPDLQSFFLTEGRVGEGPSFEQCVAMLQCLSSLQVPNDALPQVLSVLEKWALEAPMSQEELRRRRAILAEEHCKIFPTTDGRWTSLRVLKPAVIYACDDANIAASFDLLPGVTLLQICSTGKKQPEAAVLAFLEQLQVPLLSKVVHKEVITYGGKSRDSVTQELLAWTLPMLQRYMAFHHATRYCECQSGTGMQTKLNEFHCVMVDGLYVSMAMPTAAGPVQAIEPVSHSVLMHGTALYISEHAKNDTAAIWMEFTKLFLPNHKDRRQLVNFLRLLHLQCFSALSSSKDLEKFVSLDQGIPLLSEDLLWTLPASTDIHGLHKWQNTAVKDVHPATDPFLNSSPTKCWPPHDGQRAAHLCRAAEVRQLPACVEDELHGQALLWDSTGEKGPKIDALTTHDAAWCASYSGPLKDATAGSFRGPPRQVGCQELLLEVDHATQPKKVAAIEQLLQSKKLRLPSFLNEMDEKQRKVTGRWGEEFVYKQLVAKHGPDNVQWMNEQVESGACFDLILKPEGGGALHYVEVKSTSSDDKEWFEISPKEWEFARTQKDRYHIMRVYNAGQGSEGKATIVALPDPASLWAQRILRLCIAFLTASSIGGGEDSNATGVVDLVRKTSGKIQLEAWVEVYGGRIENDDVYLLGASFLDNAVWLGQGCQVAIGHRLGA
eukprot:SM000019S04954  [mRNA]  locus=s19:180237:191954:+ [translate_table: standard]